MKGGASGKRDLGLEYFKMRCFYKKKEEAKKRWVSKGRDRSPRMGGEVEKKQFCCSRNAL